MLPGLASCHFPSVTASGRKLLYAGREVCRLGASPGPLRWDERRGEAASCPYLFPNKWFFLFKSFIVSSAL